MGSITAETGSPLLDRFREVNSTFPETARIREFRASGGKVFGWLCTYVPEELVHAAGALPVRITGYQQETELDDGNAYLYIVSCSFSRSCFQMGLRGKYSCLDGVIAGSTCDGARRLFDHWRRYIKTPYSQLLSVPRKYNESTLELYYQEILDLKKNLENYLGISVTDESLLNSISLYNKSRELLERLYALRKRPEPPISGAETLEVLNASFRMPKEIYNPWLEELLGKLKVSEVKHRGKARIMVIGSVLNNPAFIKSIEDQGGLVVTDELCTSVRYFSDPVVREGAEPPLKAIARRYLTNFPCARMFPSSERFDRIIELIRNYKVDGVVSQNIRYCVHCAHDLPLLKARLKEIGIPVLALDIEYGTSGSGQIQTRVQALLEMIEANRSKSY
ncbi:MAG: 2-hydroxyacyl-CoA dehydratase family protein [Dehalococcoidia bacterium]|nr:2-hydroxyacyl-CoA dehydratase family protein [Dehalococcoidia bacterium]